MHNFNDEDAFEQLGFEDFEQLDTKAEKPISPKGPSLKARAIDFLSRREHSRLELQRKLQRHSDDLALIEKLLDELELQNWLNNERFAQSLVNRRAHKYGNRRIFHELRQQGVESHQLASIQEQLAETELERAQEIWSKKFGFFPTDQKAYAKQFRFMASRGFGPDLLRKILDHYHEDK